MIKDTVRATIKSISPGVWHGLSNVRQRLRAERKVGFVDTPILVYQMGKVGSTTVERSLRAAGVNGVFKLHFLAGSLSVRIRARQERNLIPHSGFYTGQALKRRMRSPNFYCKIITLVRDPIAHQISSLFELHRIGAVDIAGEDGHADAQRALHYLHDRLERPTACSYASEWFDKELKNVFGIDVFAHPFDKEAGYAHIEDGNTEVLVLRLEDLSELIPTVVSTFVNHKLDTAVARRSEKSHEAETYRLTKRNVTVSPEACQRIYSTPFVQHFYSEGMIADFTKRWSR